MVKSADNRGRRTRRVPSLIDRHYHWLEELSFDIVESSESWGVSATYAKGDVLVRPSYDERDDYPDVTVARRRGTEIREEPYWAEVHLHELLERRAPELQEWSTRDGNRGDGALDAAFARGAMLLRTHAGDLLEGRNLDSLDDIITRRPHHGVPGLDFPVDEPWAASAEGVWFTTDFELPRDMETYLERSRSGDPRGRAVAALKIVVASRGTSDTASLAAGHNRLHELLADPDADVRRAAASALGEWRDADALDQLLLLLDGEPGNSATPIAAAMTFIALDLPKADRQRVLESLRRFAASGTDAEAQVHELAWRLGDGTPRGYSRVVRLWRGPDDEAS